MRAAFALWSVLVLGACAMPPPAAPPPLQPIDAASFFTGRWYEMARTPIYLTHDCMAGTTDFFTRPDGQLVERDECRRGSPEGKPKVFQGPIDILNPGQNTEFVVHYTLYGVIPFAQTYWVIGHGPGWFIVSDPSFVHVAILDRNPRPSAEELSQLIARAAALGYDTRKLEIPPRFPPGEG